MKKQSLKGTLLVSTLLLVLILGELHAQGFNSNWKTALNKTLSDFMACSSGGTEASSCYGFIGESVKTVYGVTDFYSSSGKQYMSVSEIHDFVKNNQSWKPLGRAYEPEALEEAQKQANAKKAVIAVYMNEQGVGHVALILPGELQVSGSWGVKVPNSASFLPSDPDKSYVGKTLSYAFPRNTLKDVWIYVRN